MDTPKYKPISNKDILNMPEHVRIKTVSVTSFCFHFDSYQNMSESKQPLSSHSDSGLFWYVYMGRHARGSMEIELRFYIYWKHIYRLQLYQSWPHLLYKYVIAWRSVSTLKHICYILRIWSYIYAWSMKSVNKSRMMLEIRVLTLGQQQLSVKLINGTCSMFE